MVVVMMIKMASMTTMMMMINSFITIVIADILMIHSTQPPL